MTADTNDLALGPARAERDLGCTYTIGFEDQKPRLDRSRRITILFPARKGLRAISPASYVIRSTAKRASSLLETASLVPQDFLSDDLHADLIVSAPLSTRRWDTTLAVEICGSASGAPEATGVRELRAFLRTPEGTTVHALRRRMLPSESRVLERISLRPGRYVLSAVLSDPGGAPAATVREVEVPAVPEARPPACEPADRCYHDRLPCGGWGAACAGSSG